MLVLTAFVFLSRKANLYYWTHHTFPRPYAGDIEPESKLDRPGLCPLSIPTSGLVVFSFSPGFPVPCLGMLRVPGFCYCSAAAGEDDGRRGVKRGERRDVFRLFLWPLGGLLVGYRCTHMPRITQLFPRFIK